MGVVTTTDTTDNVRTSFETFKNLYGITVQVDGTIKKEENSTILKNGKINPKVKCYFKQCYFKQ